VLNRCRHKTHWWPRWRLCLHRQMWTSRCGRHERECYFGCTQEQRERSYQAIVNAMRDGTVKYRKVRRRDDQDGGAHGA
jgi:hypothetical protein